MHILITGANGFLGSMLARKILSDQHITLDGKQHTVTSITLADKDAPSIAVEDTDIAVEKLQMNLCDKQMVQAAWGREFDAIFHLAAVVSGQAEQEFELGYQVNMDATRNLLEAARTQNKKAIFFMTSSVAVFGRNLPEEMPDIFPALPLSSYGAQKAIAEILVMDYARKGFCDGRILRLPTICIRPGKPNAAASSFVSSIMREPLAGEEAICPVPPQSRLWIMSPDVAIQSMLHLVSLKEADIAEQRVIHPVGLTVTVQQMFDALQAVEGEEIMKYIRFEDNQAIKDIVLSWPGAFQSTYAKNLGFPKDAHMEEIINQYKNNHKNT